MKSIINKFIRFGFVGVICFFIDFFIYTVLCNHFGVYYLIAGILGFVIAVIVNYILSMKFVFEHRDDMSRMKEFIIFVLLSTIGLGINEFVLYVCIDVIYHNFHTDIYYISQHIANIAAKIIAAGIVMVYNFVSRKIILEKNSKKIEHNRMN